MSWVAMSRSPRYSIPLKLQRLLLAYMRRYNITGKDGVENRQTIQDLFQELGLGDIGEGPRLLQKEFQQLCRNKINNFIKTKSMTINIQGLLRVDGLSQWVEWKSSTEAWLDPAWNGDINTPRQPSNLSAQQPYFTGDGQQLRTILPRSSTSLPLDNIDKSTSETPEHDILEHNLLSLPYFPSPKPSPSPSPRPLDEPDNPLGDSDSCLWTIGE